MSSDQFNVDASWDKPSYVVGEMITGAISGTNHHIADPVITQVTVGPVDVPVVASPSGATSTAALPSFTFGVTTPGVETDEEVYIDVALFATNQGGRIWVVSPDHKSISAVA